MTTLLFFPAIACAIGVAHQASDHEDEEETDFVAPVFWSALKEGSWVLVILTLLIGRSPHMGWEDGFLDSLSLLAPATVFALAGCYVGVLFTRETMTRQAEAFGAGALTTAYLVVATTGLYYLLYSLIDPGLIDLQREAMRESLDQQGHLLSEEQREELLESLKDGRLAPTVSGVFFTFVRSLIGGFVAALGMAALWGRRGMND